MPIRVICGKPKQTTAGFLKLLVKLVSMNDISTFLTNEGWIAGQEFGISIRYKGEHESVSVTEFVAQEQRLFVASLTDDTELLLVPYSLSNKAEGMNWLPVDVENIDLASVIAAGIEKCERQL